MKRSRVGFHKQGEGALNRSRKLRLEYLERRDLLALTVEFAVDSISEAPGGEVVEATITRDGDISEPLEVILATSDASSIWAPEQVTIPAGAESFVVNLETINNPLVTGAMDAMITATAAGHADGTESITIIDDDTLQARTIGGRLTGSLSRERYLVTSDLVIDSEAALTIEPGAKLAFSMATGIRVTGTLTAEGTEDAVIEFTSSTENPTAGSWTGITTLGTSLLSLDHAVVSHATTGLRTVGGFISMQRSDIHDNADDGIIVRGTRGGGAAVLSENSIYGNGKRGLSMSASSSGGPRTGVSGQIELTGNEIFENAGAAIAISSSYGPGAGFANGAFATATIQRNYIHDNGLGIIATASDSGTFGTARTDGVISNNLIIANRGAGIELSRNGEGFVLPPIVNNTIVENEGAGILHNSVHSTIHNNIIVSNAVGIQATENAGHIDMTTHNLTFNNSDGPFDNYPAAFGTLTTRNRNGIPADENMNIRLDPIFLSDTDFHLRLDSPAIDAGTSLGGCPGKSLPSLPIDLRAGGT